MGRTEALVRAAAEAVGSTARDLSRPRHRPLPPWQRVRFVDALEDTRRLVTRRGRAAGEAGRGRCRHRRATGRGPSSSTTRTRTSSSPSWWSRPSSTTGRSSSRRSRARRTTTRRSSSGSRRRRRHGVRERLQRAERRRGAGASGSRCRRPSARPGRRSPSRATPTSSRRSPTGCRPPAAAGSASTG